MSVAIITGSAGLIGSATVRHFAAEGMQTVGIDNDMRREFFGDEASTAWNLQTLQHDVPDYRHHDIDIRDMAALARLFADLGRDIDTIVHCAAQPSHDWAAGDPHKDFSVNATGTLNLLEAARRYCPDAVFIFLSTNKVYGDRPNELPLVELETRWEIDESHAYFAHGIDETMSIDGTKHSLFGVSKASADLMVQEYGRYFGMKTACFRGGCLTGPAHSGTQLHGFLAYLMKCTLEKRPYSIFGYAGKQVRDNIHSTDLVRALWMFSRDPKVAAVYNIGGGRDANCSMLEAIALCEGITGNKLNWTLDPQNRIGDHIWWISDTRAFSNDFPGWKIEYGIETTLREIHDAQKLRNGVA